MRSMSIEARLMSLDELKEGRKTVVILFPGSNWSPVAFEMGAPPEGIFLRFATTESGLKSLPIETLIIVDALKTPENGLRLCIERLRGQLTPKIIALWGDARPDSIWTCTECWSTADEIVADPYRYR